MQWYEEEVRSLELARAARGRMAAPAVFYGSSTLRLWANLAADLGDARALNLGFGGSTLEACAFFFDRLVPPESPASLVIYAGDNDLGDGRSPDQVLASFRTMVAKIERQIAGTPFCFISIKPSPARFPIIDRIRRSNELIQREIARHSLGWYIPVFDAMLSPEGKPRPELFLDDGLHLAPAGYRLWTRLLEPYRNRIFKPVSPGCNPETLSSRQGESGISQMVQSPAEP